MSGGPLKSGVKAMKRCPQYEGATFRIYRATARNASYYKEEGSEIVCVGNLLDLALLLQDRGLYRQRWAAMRMTSATHHRIGDDRIYPPMTAYVIGDGNVTKGEVKE